MSSRGGVTLLEIIVVLVILSLLAAVVGLALPSSVRHPASTAPLVEVMRMRDSAIRSARVVTGDLVVGSRMVSVSAFPDGRVLHDSSLSIDEVTGGVRRVTP